MKAYEKYLCATSTVLSILIVVISCYFAFIAELPPFSKHSQQSESSVSLNMAAPKQQNNVKNKPDVEKDDELSTAELFYNYKIRIDQFEKNVIEFPTDNNKIISNDWKDKRDRIAFHMKETYPLVHGAVLSLAYNFLRIKVNFIPFIVLTETKDHEMIILIQRLHGSSKEKKLYDKMSMVQFFDRLATKRAVVFYQNSDVYLLRNGNDGDGKWHLIGKDDDNSNSIYFSGGSSKKPKLKDYLSYDELMISALCGISSPTYFINNGDRRNCGRIQRMTWGEFYPMEGVYMGLVGARFEKSKVMEQALMLIDQQQNTRKNGYGSYETKSNDDQKGQNNNNSGQNNDDEKKVNNTELDDKLLSKRVNDSIQQLGDKNKVIMRAFEQFYNIKYLPTFDEIKKGFAQNDKDIKNRYLEKSRWGSSDYLDLQMFKQRIRISLEIFLFDADKRAKQYKQMMGDTLDKKQLSGAFCHVVGLGMFCMVISIYVHTFPLRNSV